MEHMKPGELLGNVNAAMRKELNKTRMWDNGTKDQYIDLLDYWTQKVAKIKRRNLIEKFDGKHMSGCDCLPTNVRHLFFKFSSHSPRYFFS